MRFIFLFFSLPPGSTFVVSLFVKHVINLVWPNLIFAVYADNEISSYYQEYIIEKEGEYPTSLWYCVTTLYGGHDLCNNIHIQSGFTDCPTTSHS